MTCLPKEDLALIFEETKALYPLIHGGTIFITGGTGFFGQWLVESLVYAVEHQLLDITLVILTRNMSKARKKQPALSSPCVVLWEGDIASFEFPKQPVTHIIHMATEASAALNETQPQKMFDTIVEGTQRLLEFARYAHVKSILTTSSGAVYGIQPSDLTHLPESFSGAPSAFINTNPYAMGKYLSECLFSLFSKETQIPVKIARCFAFVGPHLPLDTHFAIGNFIRDGLAGGPIKIGGDGTPTRSYLYAADLIIWLLHIWLKGESCRPYNVGSQESFSIKEIAEQVAQAFEPHPEVKIASLPMMDKSISRYVPDTTRAQVELGLRVYTPLDQAIAKTVEWKVIYSGLT